MCMFMMKDKTKKVKQTPKEKVKTIALLAKKFSESKSGRSLAKFMKMAHK